MSNRAMLNDEDLEQVVGGAFNFYTRRSTGEKLCYVDGVGTYAETNASSKENVIEMCSENPGLGAIELADLAVSLGYLTPYQPS